MGDVWLRTTGQRLVRADAVTEIGSSRGSMHEETGYALRVVAGGKAFTLIDDSDLGGTMDERLQHACRMQDALLVAIDEARNGSLSVVIHHDPARERWVLTPASELASNILPLKSLDSQR
jgi:hypothetical protein